MKKLLFEIKSRPLYYTALALCTATLLVSSFMAVREIITQHRADQKLTDMATSLALPKENQPTAPIVTTPDDPSPALPVWHDITALRQKNPDAVGWLQIPDTGISYPVMYTPDTPEKYLRADFNGKESRSGTPFIEGSETPDADNLLIYGHNMLTNTMFSDLEQYTELSFAKAHPFLYFETETEKAPYRIYAVLYTDEKDPWYRQLYFSDAAEFTAALRDAAERSEYRLGAAPTFGQKLITLATCVGKKQQQRLLLIAVKTDKGGK